MGVYHLVKATIPGGAMIPVNVHEAKAQLSRLLR